MKPTSRSFLSIRGLVLLALLALAAVLAPQMPPVTAAPTLPAASSQSVGVNTNGVIVSPPNFIPANQIVTVPYAATNYAPSAAGYTTLTSPASNSTNTIAVAGLSSASEAITLPAGSGPYTNSVVIQDMGATTNKTVEVNVAWPTTTNATLAVYDNAVSGSPILTPKTSTAQGGSSTFEFHWTGSGWKEFSKGEVPVRMIPAATFAAMLNDLNGPSGLLALNSSGNFPSFTLDPSATFTIPSGATLVVNGTLVTTLKQRYFTTTTLEQAYVLAQGELGMAGDTGLVYIGDGSTAGGHLINFSQFTSASGAGAPVVLSAQGSVSGDGGTTTIQGGNGYYGGALDLWSGSSSSGSYGGTTDIEGSPGGDGGANVDVGQNPSQTKSVTIGSPSKYVYIYGTSYLYGNTFLYNVGALAFSPTTYTTNATLGTSGIAIANSGSRLVFTLPGTAAVGSMEQIFGLGAGGWKIGQPAGAQIVMSGSTVGTNATTVGTSGYVQSANQYDSIILVCIVANTTWEVIGGHGAYTFN